ncbi:MULTISPECIES: aldehyde dehydrogenase family protein [Halocynthiibacter]|uniref:Aldehyde dehydrogenase family protein n=1 Tax=Halocynthiibacter halioticoli TaxID=2986804 RepID=A0AAE3LP37_9RHOB|nr:MULTISPECIES: aldehyde dehydrogenase family protein [Halocynthiibacter]MCV6822942.1 aldehyde dehydrogenase family protein [Halocynthiibacter halioticoli]MCW4055943.1 aldehyde dehydrogenase family protein [Halocynthiibacter sp. SDUM655004]
MSNVAKELEVIRILSGKAFIGGEFKEPAGLETIEVENPANAETIGFVPAGDEELANTAISAARVAQSSWAALPAIERARLVERLAAKILEHKDVFARIIVREQGKPLDQAFGEVDATASFLSHAASMARRIGGDILGSDNRYEEIHIRRHAYGVVVGLTAWNYPAALAARKAGPALVAGNTFVLLSHEITPMSGLYIAQLVKEVGFPSGVFNVVSGRGPVIGRALVDHAGVDLISMTGSVRAGQEIYASAASHLKVLRLELGGKAPFVVMEDASIDRAVDAAIAARFANCGQICTCNERMYLHSKIADEFLEKFISRTQSLRIGDPMVNPDLGPKVSAAEVEKVAKMVARGEAFGDQVLLKGGKIEEGSLAKGNFIAPTVLESSSNASPLMQEEIFGPVVSSLRVDSFEQAVSYANDTAFGLSAYLFTSSHRRLAQAPYLLKFGELYLNRANGEQVQGFHTGWGKSGLGGEDGVYGFDGYLRKQTSYANFDI